MHLSIILQQTRNGFYAIFHHIGSNRLSKHKHMARLTSCAHFLCWPHSTWIFPVAEMCALLFLLYFSPVWTKFNWNQPKKTVFKAKFDENDPLKRSFIQSFEIRTLNIAHKIMQTVNLISKHRAASRYRIKITIEPSIYVYIAR